MKSKNKSSSIGISSSWMMFQSDNKQHSAQLDDSTSDMIGRSNTMSTMHHMQMTSQQEMRKLITTLERLLNDANQQKEQLEQKLQQHINRSIKRQKQFYRIIDSYVGRITSSSLNSSLSLEEDNIKILHSELINIVEQSDYKLKQKYEQLYEQNLKIMDRKITSLTQNIKTELKKSKQITNDQTGQIKNIMLKLGSMAVEVQCRNGQLVKRNNELQLKLQLLSEQKRLLLQQICQKKNLLRTYHNKCKQYEKIFKYNHNNTIQPIPNNNNNIQPMMTNSNNIKQQQVFKSKKKSISQASNINNKSVNDYVRKTITIGFNDNGLIASDCIGGSCNKTNSNIHKQKRKQNMISRNFSVNSNNNNNKITSSYSQYKHFTTHKKNTQINNIANPIQLSQNHMRIFSTQFVTSHDIIKLEKVRNQKINNVGRKSKKDYISSLTKARTNTPIQQHGHKTINSNSPTKVINQTTVMNNNNKPTTSTTQQSSHQAIFFKENTNKQTVIDSYYGNQHSAQLPNNNNGCYSREINAVNSIRNVANREKQKRMEYMNRLTQLQRKLTAIDGLVSDALVELSGMDVGSIQHKGNNSGYKSNKRQQQHNSSREQILSFAKVLCDQLKNIITTNYNSSNLNNSNITQNYHSHSYYYPKKNGYYTVTINDTQRENHHLPICEQQQQSQSQGKQITTAQLIKLLDAELNSNAN